MIGIPYSLASVTYIHACMHTYTHTHTHIYILWRVGCLPLIISISPSLNRRPSPGSRREWVCERGGALKTARSGGVWWGTPEVNGASSPPLLYAECASPRETGLFPGMHTGVLVGPGGERWGNGLPPKAASCGPAVRTRDRTARRLTGQDAGPYIPEAPPGRRRDEAATRSRRPSRTDPPGERVRPPDSAPYLDPYFLNTAPSSQNLAARRGPRSPVYFGHLTPLELVLLFLLIKASRGLKPHPLCLSFAPPATLYYIYKCISCYACKPGRWRCEATLFFFFFFFFFFCRQTVDTAVCGILSQNGPKVLHNGHSKYRRVMMLDFNFWVKKERKWTAICFNRQILVFKRIPVAVLLLKTSFLKLCLE